jgi:hypothetical protein
MVLLRTLLFSLFCLGIFTVGHCQKSGQAGFLKKNIYLDENDKEISKAKFKKNIDYAYNIDIKAVTDSIIINKLYIRNRFGKVESPSHLATLHTKINESLGIEMDYSVDIAFGYFPELSNCDRTYSTHEFYLKEPRFNLYNIPYYAVLDPEAGNPDYTFPYQVDNKNVFRTFFPEVVTCNYWIVLRPDGSFRTFKGEGGPGIFSELEKWNKKFIKEVLEGRRFPGQTR